MSRCSKTLKPKPDGFVKSPSPRRVGIQGAALRFIFPHCSVRLCTPHSSRLVRPWRIRAPCPACGRRACVVSLGDFLRSHQTKKRTRAIGTGLRSRRASEPVACFQALSGYLGIGLREPNEHRGDILPPMAVHRPRPPRSTPLEMNTAEGRLPLRRRDSNV